MDGGTDLENVLDGELADIEQAAQDEKGGGDVEANVHTEDI